jgi:hypothetical protein
MVQGNDKNIVVPDKSLSFVIGVNPAHKDMEVEVELVGHDEK